MGNFVLKNKTQITSDQVGRIWCSPSVVVSLIAKLNQWEKWNLSCGVVLIKRSTNRAKEGTSYSVLWLYLCR